MYAQKEKPKENKSRAVSTLIAQKKSKTIIDNRCNAVLQRNMTSASSQKNSTPLTTMVIQLGKKDREKKKLKEQQSKNPEQQNFTSKETEEERYERKQEKSQKQKEKRQQDIFIYEEQRKKMKINENIFKENNIAKRTKVSSLKDKCVVEDGQYYNSKNELMFTVKKGLFITPFHYTMPNKYHFSEEPEAPGKTQAKKKDIQDALNTLNKSKAKLLYLTGNTVNAQLKIGTTQWGCHIGKNQPIYPVEQ